MSRYQARKWQVIQEAQEYTLTFDLYDYSYEDIAEKTAYFEKMGRRYGLLKEFKENGII